MRGMASRSTRRHGSRRTIPEMVIAEALRMLAVRPRAHSLRVNRLFARMRGPLQAPVHRSTARVAPTSTLTKCRVARSVPVPQERVRPRRAVMRARPASASACDYRCADVQAGGAFIDDGASLQRAAAATAAATAAAGGTVNSSST